MFKMLQQLQLRFSLFSTFERAMMLLMLLLQRFCVGDGGEVVVAKRPFYVGNVVSVGRELSVQYKCESPSTPR